MLHVVRILKRVLVEKWDPYGQILTGEHIPLKNSLGYLPAEIRLSRIQALTLNLWCYTALKNREGSVGGTV